MKLSFTAEGSGPALVLLHGLLGQRANWGKIRRLLGDAYTVITPDLRNHGESPHADMMDIPALAEDVLELIEAETDGGSTFLAGHSMGGKVAMYLALRAPERVRRLAVVDIAPRGYPPQHRAVIEALRAIDLERLESRRDADRQLAERIPDSATRSFLLMNLARTEGGAYRWKSHLDALDDQYDLINGWPSDAAPGKIAPYSGDVLFIRGERSDYVRNDDEDLMRELFPRVRVTTVAGAGHLVHAERPEIFAETLRAFFNTR